jgi:hypothetical protein
MGTSFCFQDRIDSQMDFNLTDCCDHMPYQPKFAATITRVDAAIVADDLATTWFPVKEAYA